MSQSPSESNSSLRQRVKYEQGWKALNGLLKQDRSFSGHEKHCAFLNTHDAAFADVSAATGFDLLDDGRALALCDWDFDGKQDAWITNRNAPRIRLLRNQNVSSNKFVAVRLVGDGITANADAIGARVELYLKNKDVPLIRSVRAGDAFLSQTSSWLQFGIGEAEIERLVIKWPAAGQQEFDSIKPNMFYVVEQGDVPRAWIPPKTVLAPSTPQPHADSQQSRVVLAARLPMPTGSWLTGEGAEQQLKLDGKLTLVNFWTSTCPACVDELTNWTRNQAAVETAKLRVISLNLDALSGDTNEKAATLLKEIGYPFEHGQATEELVAKFDLMQQALLDRRSPMPVPTSFLIDRDGLVSIVYKGPVDAKSLLADIEIASANLTERRNASIPFAGRWAAYPPESDPGFVVGMYIDNNRVPDAIAYLKSYNEATRVLDSKTLKPTSLEDTFFTLGLLLREQQQWKDSLTAFESSLQHKPTNVRALHEVAKLHLQSGAIAKAAENFSSIVELDPNDFDALRTLALIKSQSGERTEAIDLFRKSIAIRPKDATVRMALAEVLFADSQTKEAATQLREVLKLRPNWPPAANNLAWLLATHPDDSIRNGQEAVQLATALCEATGYEDPKALDTLAAAFAEVGQFERAVSTLEKAVGILKQKGVPVPQKTSERLQNLQKGKPIRE